MREQRHVHLGGPLPPALRAQNSVGLRPLFVVGVEALVVSKNSHLLLTELPIVVDIEHMKHGLNEFHTRHCDELVSAKLVSDVGVGHRRRTQLRKHRLQFLVVAVAAVFQGLVRHKPCEERKICAADSGTSPALAAEGPVLLSPRVVVAVEARVLGEAPQLPLAELAVPVAVERAEHRADQVGARRRHLGRGLRRQARVHFGCRGAPRGASARPAAFRLGLRQQMPQLVFRARVAFVHELREDLHVNSGGAVGPPLHAEAPVRFVPGLVAGVEPSVLGEAPHLALLEFPVFVVVQLLEELRDELRARQRGPGAGLRVPWRRPAACGESLSAGVAHVDVPPGRPLA
mmetsp:Transcript_1988/g.5808  ORF Transcript_1988/g.5808 Transcript_1988/m.5808 type:complete len:345 (+) Transcript_1988:84-1118(+)